MNTIYSKKINVLLVLLAVILFSFEGVGQTITGKVTDELGSPLIGATVYLKTNTSIGVITDVDGAYSLDLSNLSLPVNQPFPVLVFSYSGFKTAYIKVLEETEINVTLEEGIALEEVVVTARKKKEDLQDVPISITSLSAEDLTRRDIVDVQDIVINTPSFTLDNFGGTKVRPAIRGLGSENTSPGQDFSTGVFLDGIYMSTNGMASVDIFDIERVEVLKGPQGTVWGKNVIGGGINFIPAKPDFENSSKITLGMGNFGFRNYGGYVNFQSSDKVAHRLAANLQYNDGFAENLTTGDRVNDLNRESFRYSLLANATDDLTIDFTFDMTTDETNGKNVEVFSDPNNNPGYEYLVNTYSYPELGRRVEFNDSNEGARREMFGFRLGLDYDLGEDMRLTSVTGYRRVEDSYLDTYNQFSTEQFLEAALATESSLTSIGIGDETEAYQFSTELKLEGQSDIVNWATGLFYSREDQDQTFFLPVNVYNPVFNADSTEVIDAALSALDITYDPKSVADDFGVFAKADVSLTDALTLGAGLRYNYNEKEFTSNRVINGAEIFAAEASDSWDQVTWRASLNYKISEDKMIYASGATGFKPGGFGPIQNSEAVVEAALDNEITTSYELGAKIGFLENKARLNVAAFTTDYEGLQTIIIQGATAITQNIESATIQGVEAELVGVIGKSLYAEARYAFIDTDVDGFGGEDNLRLLRVPEHDVTFNLRYQRRLGAQSGLVEFGGTYSYRSEVFDSPLNIDTERRRPFGLLDGYMSWESSDFDWTVRVWAKNIGDVAYSLNSFGGQGSHSAVVGNPRTFGITVSRYFN